MKGSIITSSRVLQRELALLSSTATFCTTHFPIQPNLLHYPVPCPNNISPSWQNNCYKILVLLSSCHLVDKSSVRTLDNGSELHYVTSLKWEDNRTGFPSPPFLFPPPPHSTAICLCHRHVSCKLQEDNNPGAVSPVAGCKGRPRVFFTWLPSS